MLFYNEETTKKELNVQTNIKTANRKELWLKALVNSGYTHTGINKYLVKEEKIKMESLETPFKVYNTNKTKNRKATQFVSLEMKINGHIENISIVVTDFMQWQSRKIKVYAFIF